MSNHTDPLPIRTKLPELDPSIYSLTETEFQFFQQLTGINDPDVARQHIIDVQSEAYEVYGYQCIRRFSFLKLKIAGIPGYKLALKLLQERKDPILLDIGCCFGNDLRKAVSDGWPVQNVIASDLRQAFWDYGHELFKSTPQSFPAAFVAGDVFSQDFITMPPLPPSSSPLPLLNSLNSLTPLQHKLSAIHASSFFHLFSEQRQLELAKRLASLILLKPGSVIFGSHVALAEKGYRQMLDENRFCHSPESWREMWVRDVFGEGGDGILPAEVRVHTEFVQRENFLPGVVQGRIMNWCVEIL